VPLHAGLSTDEQLRVFEPAERGHRKVIVATNIAEVSSENNHIEDQINIVVQASVTIEGVKFVIDCGFVKVDRCTHLRTVPSL
jgi:ATP-dependent RNA helicase DDX35